MTILKIFMIFTLLSMCFVSKASSNEHRIINRQDIQQNKRIVCYLGSWSLDRTGMEIEKDIDPNICTHIIYAFASFDENGAIVDGTFSKFMLIILF